MTPIETGSKPRIRAATLKDAPVICQMVSFLKVLEEMCNQPK